MQKLLHFNFSKLFVLALLMLGISNSFGQTFYDMSSGTYSQDFSLISDWTNNYVSGNGSTNWKRATSVSTSSVDQSNVFGVGTSGGVQRGDQNLILLATGSTSTSAATDLLLNFTNVNAGTISLKWSKVLNGTAGAPPRTSDFKIQYSINNGATFTDLTGYTIPRVSNNASTEAGTFTNIQLPAAVNKASQVVIRFYLWSNGNTSGSGNRPKIAIDDIIITGASTATAAPVVTASTQTATVGTAFSYQVAATNSPSGYAYTGTLPTGLTLNTTTGLISGTPTTAGSFSASITATNNIGTSEAASISFAVAKGNQTINFGTIASKQYGDANFTLSANSSSALPITYSSSNPAVATISGTTVTVIGIGSATITASQTGDANYNAATSVDQVLNVTAKSISLTTGSITAENKTYDATTIANLSGTPTLSGVLASDVNNVAIAGIPTATFTNANVGTGKVITVTGYMLTGSASGNYTIAQPAGLKASIAKAPVTITGAVVADKVYDKTKAATLTAGTLNGVFSADAASVSVIATFNTTDAGENIPVITALTGTQSANYTLTQPAITATINKAPQTITFNALAGTTSATASINLTASASSGITVTYTSSNTGVATISGSKAIITGEGSTTITASQVGNANYLPATNVSQVLNVDRATVALANWNFFSVANGKTTDIWNAATTNANITPAVLTRGPLAPWSSAGKSFRTAGFGNDGISTDNLDYFQTKLSPKAGFKISVSTINAMFGGSDSFSTEPGATIQFAYSLDGVNFKLIGSPITQLFGTTPEIPELNTSNIADLQNIVGGTTVTIRLYASGRSTAGTFGFISPDDTDLGLAFGGYVSAFNPTVWTEKGWSQGAPTANTEAVIAYEYNTRSSGDITAKALYINSGASVNVATGTTVSITENLANNALESNFVVENNGALVQTNENLNTGSGIRVIKNTNPLFRLDYTMWSSPVAGQTFGDFSPQTASNRFYEYKYAPNNQNEFKEAFFTIGATAAFLPAKSYLVRMPNANGAEGYNAGNTPIAFVGTFSGEANNGTITTALSTDGNKYTAIGNPYASPINLSDFYAANANVIENGSGLYMWRKKNNSNASSYAVLNLAGFVANDAVGGGDEQKELFTSGNSNTWMLSQGQGFIVKTSATAGANPFVTFNNSMRRPANGNVGFLRAADATPVSRLWLNITGDNAAFSQTAIAYVDGATKGLDYGYDAKQFATDNAIAIYSKAANSSLSIQARPAFDATDVVTMGYVANHAGTFTLALDHVDGVFSADQEIYLKDNELGVTKSLKEGTYTFSTDAGTFEKRFEVVYARTSLDINNPELTPTNVVVFKQGNNINITGSEQIIAVTVYDVRGRKLSSQENINATQTLINGLTVQQQVLIIEVNTVKGKVSKKIIF
jgi:hypothetical protein